jgi:hypothetical protein
MKFRNLVYTFIVALGLNTTATAQDYDLGGFVGASFYNGELYPGLDNGFLNAFRGFRPAIGGLARYNFNPHLSLRGNLNFGYVAGYDAYGNKGTPREPRNLSFHSPLLELSALVEVNLMKYVAGSKSYKVAPYVFAGVGGFYFSPHAYKDGTKYSLRPLVTEPGKSYSPVSLAIPAGIGIKYNIRNDWTLGFEVGWRKTFTDYLDDVSTFYPTSAYVVTSTSSIDDQMSNRSGQTVAATSKRGNPDTKDSYYFVGFTIYKTIRKYNCNDF